MKPKCLVVMYHYIGLYEKWSGIHGLSEPEFAGQVDGLCRTMEPIDWPTFYDWQQGKGSIPERCFLLTFDDGLVGQDRRVCPVLGGRGIRGTFLVPGAVLVAGQGLLPAHAIHVLLSKMDAQKLEGEIYPQITTSLCVADAHRMYHYETINAHARIKYALVMEPRDRRNTIIRELFEKHVGSMGDYANRWYMNVTDLRRMQDAGHTIGGHGFSHEPYGGMTAAEVVADMRKTAAVLRSGFDTKMTPQPRPFSYPYGQYKGGAERACRDAGFATAFTTERRWADDSCGPYRVPRVDTMYLEANNDAGFTVEPEATDDTVPAVSGVREG